MVLPNIHTIGRGDHNGDGSADILWRKSNPGQPDDGQMAIWLMQGGALLDNIGLPSVPGTDWQVVGRGDYDGDGFLTALDLGINIDVLFAGTPDITDPNCPTSRGDLDCDGFNTALDLGIFIDHLFAGGPPPCDPCTDCSLPGCP